MRPLGVIDRNAAAAYLIARRNPGCPKSMLYISPRARRMVEWMLEDGYLMPDGKGVRLTDRGERMGEEWMQVAYEAGQGSDIEQLVEATLERYAGRLRG